MSRLEEKVGEYKVREADSRELGSGVFSHRERAEMESEIWSLVPALERQVEKGKQGRGHWLAKALGGVAADYQHRCQLLSWGSAVDVLWGRLEADMTLSTVIDLLRKAKKLPGEMPDAVRTAVAEYDARPNVSKQANGKVIRRRAMARLPDLKGGAKPAGKSKSGAARSGTVETVWNRLRGELGAYVAGRLADLDPRIGEELYRDFERDLNGLLFEYQQKIDRVRSTGTATMKVSRRLVIDACAVLALDPPAPGRPADLVLARRHQRKLAKRYHPDANMGDESMRAQYERVMQAYDRLDAYNVGLGKKGLANGASAVVVEEPGAVNAVNKEDDHGRGSQSGAQ